MRKYAQFLASSLFISLAFFVSVGNAQNAESTGNWDAPRCGEFMEWRDSIPHSPKTNIRVYASPQDAVTQSLVPQDVLLSVTPSHTPEVYLRDKATNLQENAPIEVVVPIWLPVAFFDVSGSGGWTNLNLDFERFRFRQGGGKPFKVFHGEGTAPDLDGGNTNGGLDNYRCITEMPDEFEISSLPPANSNPPHGYVLVFFKGYLFRSGSWTNFLETI